MQFLEHFGYLDRQSRPGHAALYIPTPAFRAAWDRQFVAALQAAQFIAPDVGILLEPGQSLARQAYGRIHAEGMLAAMLAEPQVSNAFLRVFLHPYAGNHVLWTLIVAGIGPDFPTERSGPVSIAGLARSCSVSRMQVARIFHEAAAEGLAELGDDGFVHFHAAAREQLGFFYAIQLVQILAAAARASRCQQR